MHVQCSTMKIRNTALSHFFSLSHDSQSWGDMLHRPQYVPVKYDQMSWELVSFANVVCPYFWSHGTSECQLHVAVLVTSSLLQTGHPGSIPGLGSKRPRSPSDIRRPDWPINQLGAVKGRWVRLMMRMSGATWGAQRVYPPTPVVSWWQRKQCIILI